MSDKNYGIVEGMVQFDPKRERQVNGVTVCDVTIKCTNLVDHSTGEQKLASVTIWPEFGEVFNAVKKGDVLFVDGEIRTSMGQAQDGSPRQYINLSPNAIGFLPAYVRPPRSVVQAPAVTPVAVQPVQAAPAIYASPAVQPVAAPVAAPAPSTGSLF